jgi:hypothetical protein
MVVFAPMVSSQTADVIIILMMIVAWKLADPGIGESGGRNPSAHDMDPA